MKKSMKTLRMTAISLISALLLYGVSSVVFTSRDLGRTFDERLYNDAGLIYLNQHRFDENHDHPPLSKWVAALYPYYSGDQRVESFRYAHAVIYAVGGGVIAFQLLAWEYSVAAIIFAFLYFLCPNTKAMSSLNVLDGDIAIVMGVLALYTWRGFSSRAAGWMGILQGTAAVIKISGLFYIPFLFLRLRQLKSVRPYILAFAGFFSAFLVAYHFRVFEFGWYGASLGFQWKHNHAGQVVHVLGKSSLKGFWYTYLVLFLLKTPVPSLVLMIFAAILFIRSPRSHIDHFIYLISPALLMFFLLSMGNVQMGLRYALAAIIYLYIATALVIDQELKSHKNVLKVSFVAVACLSLLVCDGLSLKRDTYIAYFNFLSPDPIKNFCDSNIDWQQGIPFHLAKFLPPHESIETISAFRAFSSAGTDHFNVEAGASNLCGAMSSRLYVPSTVGPLLLDFSPIWQGGGYEILDLTSLQLFALWRIQDESALGSRSSKEVLGLVKSYSEKCGPGHTAFVQKWVGDGIGGRDVRAKILSDVLVSVTSSVPPSWSDGKGSYPFTQDGGALDEHAWRAWIPRESLKDATIKGATSQQRVVTAAVACR